MRAPTPPAFLARASYRRRRIIDAARLVPVLGLFLFMLPILWRPAETPEPDTARGGIYLFAVWSGLIVTAFVLARVLSRTGPQGGEDEPPDGGPR